MTRRAVAGLLLQLSLAFADPSTPPDTSLARLPIAYYGAQWARDDTNVAALSRMTIVILMQVRGRPSPQYKRVLGYLSRYGIR